MWGEGGAVGAGVDREGEKGVGAGGGPLVPEREWLARRM